MNDPQENDTCIVWQTHRLDAVALDEYRRLAKDCDDKFYTLVLYDDSRHDFRRPAAYPSTRFSTFDINDLNNRYSLNHFRRPVSVTPGNTIFPLMDFARDHQYSNYIFQLLADRV